MPLPIFIFLSVIASIVGIIFWVSFINRKARQAKEEAKAEIRKELEEEKKLQEDKKDSNEGE